MNGSFSLPGVLRDDEAARVELEIREELDAHLELCVDELLAAGRTPEEARREAGARFGDLDKTLRACRRVQLGGRLAMQKLQWILIVLLAGSTLMLGLHGRSMAQMAHTERAMAMAQAQHAMAALEELRQREQQVAEPVEFIVVGVGDTLTVANEFVTGVKQVTQVQADGQALLAELGWVSVAGLKRQDVEALLTQRYAQYYTDAGPVYVVVQSVH